MWDKNDEKEYLEFYRRHGVDNEEWKKTAQGTALSILVGVFFIAVICWLVVW